MRLTAGLQRGAVPCLGRPSQPPGRPRDRHPRLRDILHVTSPANHVIAGAPATQHTAIGSTTRVPLPSGTCSGRGKNPARHCRIDPRPVTGPDPSGGGPTPQKPQHDRHRPWELHSMQKFN
ncbi:hypothetical protein NDU88_001392 [Pleurodeles waltl]|uniref:Uncharacterized protein n=1 Tax=Pleurodeles waltl TaxID=8319 RepID=A0AAV7USM1_PLEWA|nr:hypothetical protein NDU88_001392 [Pleurodeles waltl]